MVLTAITVFWFTDVPRKLFFEGIRYANAVVRWMSGAYRVRDILRRGPAGQNQERDDLPDHPFHACLPHRAYLGVYPFSRVRV